MGEEGEWRHLGQVDWDSLAAARVELHWAAQLIAAAGYAHAEARDDQSHTSLVWNAEGDRLVGSELQVMGSPRLELAVVDLTLHVGASGPRLALAGRSLSAAYAWLAVQLNKIGGWASLTRPPYAMPYPRGENVLFRRDRQALADLARWYAVADLALQRIAAAHDGASPVRCWPHHFDIATLLDLGDGMSIGVGMTPGDDSYRQPYWYVTPWPRPANPELGLLPGGGHWREEGWFGAVLTGPRTIDRPTQEQRSFVQEFLEQAITQALRLVQR